MSADRAALATRVGVMLAQMEAVAILLAGSTDPLAAQALRTAEAAAGQARETLEKHAREALPR